MIREWPTANYCCAAKI